MDKNMINIDDLFKQRMTGAEETERPGSWLQMRELLEKEMPVTAPGAATNWRRMFGRNRLPSRTRHSGPGAVKRRNHG